jgi:hypothetical protein
MVKATIAGVERWQMRQIAGSEGWATFNSLDALMGLGDASVIETLRVEWPSGIAQELYNLPVKLTFTIVERTELAVAPGASGTFGLTVQGPRQQRYRLESSANLANWVALASLIVTNANGTASYTYTQDTNESALFFRATPE